MTDKDKLIDILTNIFDNTKRIHGDSEAIDWVKVAIHKSAEYIAESELAEQKPEETHKTCDGCQMFAECGCMLDDSCQQCVEHDMWTPKERKPLRTAEEIKDITLKYLKSTYPNQNHLYKDTEKTFENYTRCRSFKDFSSGYITGKEYAQQFQKPAPTKEDIEQEAQHWLEICLDQNKYFDRDVFIFCAGANWVINNYLK